MKTISACVLLGLVSTVAAAAPDAERPNVILLMADDLGWGDTGYNGHAVLKTPNLDRMAGEGIRFDRFYSGAPVCSPTRGSCLTGRHPYRYGIFFANTGHVRKQEITLAEALKTQGYATGHFGKWHLGTLLPDYSGKGPRRNPAKNYATPGMNGFDEWFSTEYAVATWDPYEEANAHGKFDVRNLYWHNGKNVTEGPSGCDSRIIMDKALPLVRGAAEKKRPFLAVIWFHAPHAPVVAGPEYRKMYADRTENEQHYFGCITAMDEQIGRLRKELDALGVAENTMLWFCSDNGPEGPAKKRGRHQGSAGPLRGRKRSLYEGGVRVPGLLVWPARIKGPRVVKTPCSTSDYFPTVLDCLGFTMKGQPEPIDGVSLMPLIDGRMTERPRPIGFESSRQVSLTDNRYKIYSGKGKEFELYDLLEDPGEQKDLAAQKPEIVERMRATLDAWRASCKGSLEGKDYR